MKITDKVKIIYELVKKGFLATNNGYYVKIVKGEPIVIYYDWNAQIFVIDRAEYSGTFATIAELDTILNYTAKQARDMEFKKKFESVNNN